VQILLGLSELHKHNICYRDLKPENVLVDKFGYIKLTDFGVSKLLKPHIFDMETMVGTPEYMAPEVLQRHPYDKSCDWWSFGIFL
jgi:serine/threonine protein kinase